MAEMRLEKGKRIATCYRIQGICSEKIDKVWTATVLLKEYTRKEDTKAIGVKLCARNIESLKKLIFDIGCLYGVEETMCIGIPEEEGKILWSYPEG